MELLLILLPLALLGAVFIGGNDDNDDSDNGGDPPPDDEQVVAEGGNGPDTLSGGSLDDLLMGARGDDALRGAGAADLLLGEGGADTLFGGSGDDALLAGRGDDELYGESGVDILIGGAGNDALYGGADSDFLTGVSGANSLYGGAGDDVIWGLDKIEDRSIDEVVVLDEQDLQEAVEDRLGEDVRIEFGGRIEDARVSASDDDAQPDLLEGGFGNDFIAGDSGDTMTGGAGTDDFLAAFAPGDAPVQITDFDAATERLEMLVSNPATAAITITDGVNGAEVRVDAEVAVILAGVQASAITAGSITLSSL